jgi:hypothetical protein
LSAVGPPTDTGPRQHFTGPVNFSFQLYFISENSLEKMIARIKKYERERKIFAHIIFIFFVSGSHLWHNIYVSAFKYNFLMWKRALFIKETKEEEIYEQNYSVYLRI